MLDSEKAVLEELERQYKRALRDINDKIKLFDYDIRQLEDAINADGLDEAAKAVLKSQQRAKVYQKQYQQALKGQISGVIDNLHAQQYATIDKYLKDCYTDSFIGTMYSIAKQGIPLIVPINQAAVVKAVLTDSKIKEGFYNHLGVNYAKLKKVITQEVSRGIASSLPYRDIARNINNASQSGLYNAQRIARTEGHRIQQTSADDARHEAIKSGADLVKQWDAALDSRTRDSHARVDGEIREEDEKFSNGLLYPGDPAGSAAEVINCRCVALSRARWALDENELETLRERARYFGLLADDSKEYGHYKAANTFHGYKEKYLAFTESSDYNTANSSDSSVFAGIISNQNGMTSGYEDALKQRFSNGSDEAKKAFNKYVPSDSVENSAYKGTAHFSPSTQKVNMNFADDLANKRGSGVTFFHEHGHYIDFMAAGASNYAYISTNSQVFGALLQSDFKDYVKAYKKQHNMNAADAYRAISFELYGHEKHSLSDLIDGISKGKCRGMYGHKRSYWTYPGALEREAFAHMFEATFDGAKYSLIRQYFPNALAEFEKMLKGVI